MPPHHIETSNQPPTAKTPFRVPAKWKETLREHTQELLELSIIHPSTSTWVAASVPVGKKEGSLWFCQDNRPLNDITYPDPYYMNKVDKTFNQLGEAFSLLSWIYVRDTTRY